jgi:hypothetical protein
MYNNFSKNTDQTYLSSQRQRSAGRAYGMSNIISADKDTGNSTAPPKKTPGQVLQY